MSLVNKEPLVSIIIPSYNRAKFLDKAIQSALDQDYPNIEIIISDNHSTDNTTEVANKFVFDKRVKYYLNEENIGLVANFKIATEQRAKGEYISYICSDDFYSNNQFISKALDLVDKYSNVVLVAAKNSTLFDDNNVIVHDQRNDVFQQEFMIGKDVFNLFPKWFFPGWGGVFIHRKKLIGTKAFESQAQSLDYEANLKLMLLGNVAFIKEPSYVWRRHSTQASGTMTFDAQVKNLDFIENTYDFAKKMNAEINLEEWRQQAYLSYVNGAARRSIKRKDELVKFINYIKNDKKIKISFFKSPKLFLLLKLYKNYNKISFLLKIFYPGLYKSIERDIN